jgi:hypothetical protein
MKAPVRDTSAVNLFRFAISLQIIKKPVCVWKISQISGCIQRQIHWKNLASGEIVILSEGKDVSMHVGEWRYGSTHT